VQKAYKLSILYFIVFSLLLVVSAIILFNHNIGFSIDSITAYYMGNEEKFIASKSWHGILKIILPHTYVFGLFSMVILHFLVFTKVHYKKSTLVLIYTIFFTAFTEMFSPFMIINGYEIFAYLKLFSFVTFLASIIYTLWLLFHSIIYE
jgi:hypothetical protein